MQEPQKPASSVVAIPTTEPTAAPAAPAAPAPIVPAIAAAGEIAVPLSERVTLLELREGMCRWPIGDPREPEFRFCGARSPGASAYCGYHAQVAYTTPAEQKRAAKAWRESHRKPARAA